MLKFPAAAPIGFLSKQSCGTPWLSYKCTTVPSFAGFASTCACPLDPTCINYQSTTACQSPDRPYQRGMDPRGYTPSPARCLFNHPPSSLILDILLIVIRSPIKSSLSVSALPNMHPVCFGIQLYLATPYHQKSEAEAFRTPMWHTGHVLSPISCSNPQSGCVSSLITDHHCIYPRPSYLTERHALTAPLEAGAYVLAYLTDSSHCNRPCYVGSTLREPLYEPFKNPQLPAITIGLPTPQYETWQ